MVQTGLVTVEELERMPDEDAQVELVKGVIVRMPPAGHYPSSLAADLLVLLGSFVRQHRLGRVYGADGGFILARDPDTVRAPDVAFVRQERLQGLPREGFFPGAPDLAVEVVSPTDTLVAVEAKVMEYLEAGTKLVWVFNPRNKTVTAHRSARDVDRYTIEDTLEAGDLLPGFGVPLGEIFE